MANTIRIKRRASGSGSGAPVSLANAELAFNEQTNILYYGTGTGGSGGSATQVIAIGGDGAFATKNYVSAYAPLAGASFSGDVGVGGNLTVTGNLTINGTTTTINSTAVSVDDKNILLGDTASPTDTTADGGGITLRGTTDKSLTWENSTDSWLSSEHVNLVTGKSYLVNGVAVLSSTALGSGVLSSSLTSVGTVTSGTWSASIDNATIDCGTF